MGRWGPPLLILAVALWVRLSYLDGIEAYPKFERIKNRLDDQVVFDAWAASIVRGERFDYSRSGHEFAYWAARSPGVFPQAPLYPYWIAGWYRISGFEPDRVRLAQGLAGAFTCVVLFWIAQRFVFPGPALLAGLGAAIYGPWVFYESTYLRASLLTTLLTLALWLLLLASEHRTRIFDFAAGLCLGLGVLMRPTVLAFAVPAIAWLVWDRKGRGLPLAAARWATLGLILPLVPVVAVNNAGGSGPAFLSSNGPYIFFLGNVHDAAGTSAGPSPYYFEVKARDGNPEPVNLLAEALADIRRHPGAFLHRLGAKTRAFFAAEEIPNNLSFAMARRENVRLRWAFGQWHWLFPWAAFGFFLGLGRARQCFLLYLLLGTYAGGTILFYVLGRLRQPAALVLLLFAALAWQWIWERIRQRKWVPALLVVGLAVGASIWETPRSLLRETDFQMAAAARFSLAQELEWYGREQEARDEYARAVVLNPEHRRALERLARYGKQRRAPLSEEVEGLLAEARSLARSRPEEAMELLHRASVLAPDASEPLHFLSNVLYLEGDRAAAEEALERAVFLDPLEPLYRKNLLALRREARAAEESSGPAREPG